MNKTFVCDPKYGVCMNLIQPVDDWFIKEDYFDNIKQIWEQLYAEQEGWA